MQQALDPCARHGASCPLYLCPGRCLLCAVPPMQAVMVSPFLLFGPALELELLALKGRRCSRC